MRTLCGSWSWFSKNSVKAESAGAVTSDVVKAVPWATTTTAPGGAVGRGAAGPPHAAAARARLAAAARVNDARDLTPLTGP
jgi:hypothetical protein